MLKICGLRKTQTCATTKFGNHCMKKLNNGPVRTCLFLGLLLLSLLILRALPPMTVGDYEVKPVDILSDLQTEIESETPVAVAQHVAAIQNKQATKRDSCPEGMTCVEDYADSTGHGMTPFYEALSRRAELGRPVRVAYFGDSFIEGDILTADLRAMLQKRFGGCGVGFVDIASPFIELRPTVHHKAEGWTDHNVLEKSGCDHSRLGITGRYAISGVGATVNYRGVKDYERLDTFEVATLYLSSSSGGRVDVSVNGGSATPHYFSGTNRLETVRQEGHIGSVGYVVDSGATCFGVALEGHSGITLDNFSLRGSSGLPLAQIPESHLTQLAAERPYDLIVLQFGLNVADKKRKNYDGYVSQMKKVIARFKEIFPHTSILVVSIGDREDKVNGQLQTMPGVKTLLSYQQVMAAESGVAFWNLYQAMGGEGAMVRMAEAQPAEAGKDYTHINRRGGKRVAGILYRTLIHGYEQYEKQKGEYERE